MEAINSFISLRSLTLSSIASSGPSSQKGGRLPFQENQVACPTFSQRTREGTNEIKVVGHRAHSASKVSDAINRKQNEIRGPLSLVW